MVVDVYEVLAHKQGSMQQFMLTIHGILETEFLKGKRDAKNSLHMTTPFNVCLSP